MTTFRGYDLNNLERKCIKEVAELSRKVATEGIILLENKGVLPFVKSKTVSIFGRTQIDYVKSGTGSGGLVNVEYTINVVDGLKDRININQDLLNTYLMWLKENPFDVGNGWAQEPWSQKEMPITDEICVDAAAKSDYALIIIGRTAGEDRDNYAGKGSYLLSLEEENMIATVSKHFEKVCVALNVGNIIDMKWVEKYNIPCVLYCWQGGQEGGNALADVLLGDVSPSGRLTDTIAYDINDYPSTKNFGNKDTNIYEEDIYIGYRYFETFAKDKVMYPFGYGLSYTDFEYNYHTSIREGMIKVSAEIKNIGKAAGVNVVQVYYSAPQGKLGKPLRQLIGYKKTKLLAQGETETVDIEFSLKDMASYDDISEFAYVLEQGEYIIYAGENVRDAKEVFRTYVDFQVVEKLRQNLAPMQKFNRIKPIILKDKVDIDTEPVTICRYDIRERMKEHITLQQSPTGNQDILLKDVKDDKATLDDFIMQLSAEELTYLVKGEGMNSPKVTGGTGCCFGGVTDELLAYGIPPVCGTDGPSGIRMDTGHKATLIPNGTCLASTWNDELIEELHTYLGIELRANDIDVLLGPGMNIHRNPLNGRNFEYFSEDPYLTGMIGAACAGGMLNVGVAATIKHFACNSQEVARHDENSVLSERALREIYLKPFEIAVKTGNAQAIMTSYNKVNGTYAATNYDLCTSILRDEWGYDGFVMSDWWADLGINDEKNKTDMASMVMAQNDVYMVTASSKNNEDNLIEAVQSGNLDIGFLRKCAKNLLKAILTLPAMERKPKYTECVDISNCREVKLIDNVKSNTEYDINGAEVLEFKYTTTGAEAAQYVINIFADGKLLTCALAQAATTEEKSIVAKLPEYEGKMTFAFAAAFDKMDIVGYKSNL